VPVVICPLCGQRRARRGCPGINGQICSVCCGTKRLVEIRCPSDCVYLATAREHPAAPVVRQQQRDLTLLARTVRDFNDRQSQIFLLLGHTLLRYQAPELHPLVDADVTDAADALAGTLDTAARGVIYEQRPATASAERLWRALKAVLDDAGRGGGSSFERDAASVLRAFAASARDTAAAEPANRRAFVDLLNRTIRRTGANDAIGANDGNDAPPGSDVPRLIVP
jgi:hypothetical protein